MALAEAFVDIVGDPKRFDKVWTAIKREVKDTTFTVGIAIDDSSAVRQLNALGSAVPHLRVEADVDTSHIVPEVLAAEEAIPDPEIRPDVDPTRMQRKLAAAGETSGAEAGAAFLSAFRAALLAGVLTIGAALGALTAFGLKSAATLEQTQVAFESLAGSAEKGQKIFKDLQAFAAATPFEFPELTTSARRLLAMGDAAGIAQNQLEGVLTTIGNVASVTGAGAQGLDRVTLAMGQIASRGKLSLEEINQISEALPGFSGVAAIAAARGTTTAQAMDDISAGTINAKEGIAALLAGMQKFPGAAGAMEKQAQTLLGVFSTFKDVASQTLSNAFTPVIPAIKASLGQLTPVIGDALGQLGPALGGALASILPFVGQLLQALTPIIGPVVTGLAQGLAALGPSLVPLGKAIGGLAVALQPALIAVGQLAGALGDALAPVVASLIPVFTQLLNVAEAALKPLLPLIVQIGQAAADFLAPIGDLLADLFDQLAPIIADAAQQLATSLLPVLAALGPAAVQIVNALLPLLPAIVALLPPLVQMTAALTPLIVLLAQLLTLAVSIAAPIIKLAALFLNFLSVEALAPALQAFADSLTQVLGPLNKFFASFSKVSNFIQNINWAAVGKKIADGLGIAVKAIGNFFAKLPGQIGSFLASLPGLLADAFNKAFDAALTAVGIGIGLILAEIIGLPKLILAGLAALPGLIADLFTFLWQKGTEITFTAIDGIVNFVTSLPQRIGDALAALPGILANAFQTAFTFARDIALRLLGEIIDAVRSIPGRIAAFGDSLFAAGQALISGFARGIRNVGSFIGDVAGDIVGAIKGFLNRVISKINDGIGKVDAVFPGDLPRIPLLASGGLALGPSIIGERRRELAVPLDDPRAQEAIRQALGGAMNGGPQVTFGPGSIVVNPVPGMSAADARAIGAELGAGIAGTLARRDIRTAVRLI